MIIKFRNIQGPFVQQVFIGRTVLHIDRALGDELIEVIEALIIAHIDNQTAILINDGFRPFVFKPAQSRALYRR